MSSGLKKYAKYVRKYLPWLALLLALDGFFAFLLWLADAESFRVMVPTMLLATGIVFAAMTAALSRREEKKQQAFEAFLSEPEMQEEQVLCRYLAPLDQKEVHLLGELLRTHEKEMREQAERMNGYQEYVESWAHEVKNPLALLTMVLDNHREELPEAVAFRLDYTRSRMQEQIDQMLYYARLRGSKQDYRLERISIQDCIEEVLEDYKPLLEEKKIRVSVKIENIGGKPEEAERPQEANQPDTKVHPEAVNQPQMSIQPEAMLHPDTVLCDRRGLLFILSQAVSNSIKYTKEAPSLIFSLETDSLLWLCIKDNGQGVRACDLPFVFEKGFTGGGAVTKRATGMGLYLAREVAKDMGLSLEARSTWGEGFELRIGFPRV